MSAAVRSDDSTSLMYCDYDTMQQLLLCSQPNCAHNTAACNGYLPYSAGGIVPEIVGQNLVLFYPGNVHAEENATPAAHRNDGVRRFRPNRNDHLCSQPRVSAPNGHRRGFYLCLYVGNLRQLNGKLSGTHRPNCRNLRKMFSMDSTWIKGVVGDKLLLKSTSGDNSEWFTYDPVTGEQAVLYTESSSVLQPAAVYGQTLVLSKGRSFSSP